MAKQKRSKPVKIQETFYDFLEMHPEIKVNRDEDGDIINLAPANPEVDISSQTIINNEPVQIAYKYKGVEIIFPPVS